MKQILITTEDDGLRAAVLEDEKLIDLLDDLSRETRLAGSVFKGKVQNVVTGIQAAFVDIGLSKNAFLYVGDVFASEDDGDERELPKIVPTIENFVKTGQDLIVQIIRESVGGKGARVTTNLSLPGRFVVLLPGKKDYLGLSRKIKDEQERQRLRELGARLKPDDAGLIIRTLAEGVSEKELLEEIEKLLIINEEIKDKVTKSPAPGLLYCNGDPFSRLLRETIDEEVEKIIIDDGDLAELLRKKLKEVGSSVAGRIWTDLRGGLYDRYHINNEIRKTLQAKVTLQSGGYLVIEQTEALTAIDVNSGKYLGSKSLQDTLLSLNLEAAAEISRQIRLRNISGIIILDFIDMEKKEDWDKLIRSLEVFCLKDKAKCKVIGLTKLGLVEVTRKKEGQTLAARYAKRCPKCDGKGWMVNDISPLRNL